MRGAAGKLCAMRSCSALVLAIVIAATPANAERRKYNDPSDVSTRPPAPVHTGPVVKTAVLWRDGDIEPRVSAKRRAAAVALAIVPGVVVHGIGSWMVGEKRAAKRILGGEVIGLGIAGIAGAFVGGSGGNPYTIFPGVPLVMAGSGLFLQSWASDIWIAAGGEHVIARPRARAPWSLELGGSWLKDAYRSRFFTRTGASIWLDTVGLDRIGLDANALIDTGGDSQHADGSVHVRILGAPASGAVIDDGSRITVRAGPRFYRDTEDRVSQLGGELEVSGRLDLDHVDRAFGKSFVELGTGVGVVRVKYGDTMREWSSTLLGHFAWGTYIGERGEAALFYEHTRDGLVGGFPAWRAAGFVGFVGARADVRVHGPWALRGEVAFGTAWLSTVALAYRGGSL